MRARPRRAPCVAAPPRCSAGTRARRGLAARAAPLDAATPAAGALPGPHAPTCARSAARRALPRRSRRHCAEQRLPHVLDDGLAALAARRVTTQADGRAPLLRPAPLAGPPHRPHLPAPPHRPSAPIKGPRRRSSTPQAITAAACLLPSRSSAAAANRSAHCRPLPPSRLCASPQLEVRLGIDPPQPSLPFPLGPGRPRGPERPDWLPRRPWPPPLFRVGRKGMSGYFAFRPSLSSHFIKEPLPL